MIFRHIEVALSVVGVDIRPHLMDPDLLAIGQTSTTGRRLMARKMVGSAISRLWDTLSSDPEFRVLEQEAIDPRLPV